MIIESDFKPAWWLKNCHLQTILPRVYRKNHTLNVTTETLTLPDGDFVDLAWTRKPEQGETTPIVAVFHGLEGSINSFYARGMMDAIRAQGWIGVLMHFRGCSGKLNKHARAYHSGETEDARFFLNHIQSHYPTAPLSAIGFSLGGNVLTKYLGEESHLSQLASAVVISAPLHLAGCAERISRRFSRIYQKYLLDMLKNTTIKKMEAFKSAFPLKLSADQIARFKTLMQFDDAITAPLHGFKSAADYYAKASGLQFLKSIKTPSLFIHAKDDPFMSHSVIPSSADLSPTIQYELSEAGGHVGFLSGKNPMNPTFWLEKRAPLYIAEQLKKFRTGGQS